MLGCSLAIVSYAATMQSGEVYTVPAHSTTEGDVYFGGKTFLQEGTTTGDVVVGASDVTLSGNTKGEALLAGGTVWIKGAVDGDVRVVGGVVTVYGTLHEDLLVVAGTLVVAEGAHIEGDVYGFVESADIRGVIDGTFRARAQSVVISGVIKKDTSLTVAQGISLTKQAHLYGSFSYHAPREAYRDNAARIDGEVTFSGISLETSRTVSALIGNFLFTCLILLVGAGFLVRFVPSFVHTVSSRVFVSGPKEVLGGFGFLVITPFIALMLCVSMVGLLLGACLFFVYGGLLVVSLACMPILLGVACARLLEKNRARLEVWATTKKAPRILLRVLAKKDEESFAWTVFGVLVFVLLTTIPVVGVLVASLLFFLVVYALCILCMGAFRKN